LWRFIPWDTRIALGQNSLIFFAPTESRLWRISAHFLPRAAIPTSPKKT